MTRVFLAFLSLCLAAMPAIAQDPLFSHMEGHWEGSGVRTYLISARKIGIAAEVTTSYGVIRGKAALFSQNHITEKASDGSTRDYMTQYWVRPSDSQPGTYELGAPGSEQATSSGVLGPDGVFRVKQDLSGGSGPASVRSETQFSTDRTVYSDTFSLGTEIQSQSQIEYQRITP